ncbi:MAG: spermidine/putrescine ABC transporter substrate-binding protein [Acidimicrobiia bacterium]|nr:spermidine/putrescine ABC transporter substrate-binding protein [Acidimicrobiia bacterium]
MTNKRPSQRRGNRDALMRELSRQGIDRREFLRKAGGTGLFLIGGPALLAACGVDGSETATTLAGTGGTATTAASGPKKLVIANWPFYIDPGGDDSYFETSSLDDFMAETGIELEYIEEVNDNDGFFGKYQAPLSAGENIGRDIAVLTDWMAARFIQLGWVDEINKANVPNAANLVAALESPGFDPDRTYTLPWQSGFTAIGYNPALTGGELSSINDIFDPAIAGSVSLLTEMRDTLGLVMLGMGLDPATFTMDEARQAMDKIQENVDNGQIRQFLGNDYTGELASGNLAAAFAWSGDIIQLQIDNPDLQFLIPEEGLMLWSDNMLIPKGATNKAEAEAFMNYVYDPVVAAKIESWVNYICPVAGAQEALRQLGTEMDDEELAGIADDPLIFPDEATLAKTHIFRDLSEEEEIELNELFAAVTGG